MNDRLVNHIRNKLFEKNEIYDHFDVPSDDVIKYIMMVTFNVVEDECKICLFCQNYNRFSLFSLCKIKNHTQKNCYHFTMDVRKVLKNKYYKILVKVSESTWGKHLRHEWCSSKTKKNIVYESIKLYEALSLYYEVTNDILIEDSCRNIEGPHQP